MFSKKCFQCCLIPLVSIVAMILFVIPTSLAAEKKAFTWGTTSNTSGWFSYYVAASKILNKNLPDINVTVRSTGGVIHNIRLLEKREIDIGNLDTKSAWEAIHGKEGFEGKPFPDLRMLAISATNPLQFVVSEKSGIKTIYDFEGKTYCPGMLGSSAEKTTMDIFKTFGVRPNLRHMSYADAIEAMKDERVVGFSKFAAPDASIMEVSSIMKIRIISFSDDEIAKIEKNVPGLIKMVVPSGIYREVGEFKTFANENSDYVRKDFPDDLAYKWVKVMWENRSEIKRANGSFIGDRFIDVALGVKVGHLHSGTIRFFRDMGFTVPKHLVPPEMNEK